MVPKAMFYLKKSKPVCKRPGISIKNADGRYGVQISINDSRLKNYLQIMYGNGLHYKPINLYRPKEPLKYSMNWVISKRTLDSMDKRLYSADVRAYMVKILHEIKK